MTTLEPIRLDQLDARLRAVWLREQKLNLIAGLLAFCRWAVPLFLVFVFIDWLTYMPAAGRAVMGGLVLGVSVQRGWTRGWRLLRPFDAVRTALQIESRHGEMKSLLVSAIQLRSNTTSDGGSSVLREYTCSLAEQAATTLKPEHSVPYSPLTKPGIFAAVAAGAIVAFAAVNSTFFTAGVTRIFAPWVAIEYPTNTQITLAQDQLVIKEGDGAVIEAQIGGVIPDQARIYVRTGEGRAREIELDIADGKCRYTIDSASRDFTYRIKAGDDRTTWQDVRVVPAPRLQRVAVQLAYPDYLQREADTIEALTLTAPEGSSIKWDLTLDQPISAARFIPAGGEPIALMVGEDGRSVRLDRGVTASQGYNFEWVEKENGFAFTSPRYYLQVASDQVPRVELVSPASNVVAMIGRPLELAVRAQDDHDIGSARVLYQVNQFDEKAYPLDKPIQAGQGDQPIDWDYRQALPDIKVGDTVAFTIEVADRYPGDDGPHVARSETRRITFLSREQYLEQIGKQKDRLLSRVQTIYRQQRSAHQVVRGLSVDDEGYRQACQLEAIRQEMVREQLIEIARQLQSLLDDLAANGVADAPEGDSLGEVRDALLLIADAAIKDAAQLLRTQSASNLKTGQSASDGAADAVNAAARDLASLVMLRSIDAAQEVYAREARMLAQEQAALRWRTVSNLSREHAETIAQRQVTLGQWTDSLTTQLLAGMRYDRRPLAVLRLTRSVKELVGAGTSDTMRETGSLIQQGDKDRAISLQAETVRALLNAEFSVRLSGAYSTVLKTRDQIRELTRSQQRLSEQTATLSNDQASPNHAEIADRQDALRERLITLMLPPIPAPRAELFDETLPQPPPVEQLLRDTDHEMARALSLLRRGETQSAVASQQQAGQTLAELTKIIEVWSVEMGLQAQGLGTVVAASSDGLSRLEAFEVRVLALLEQTDIAALEEKKTDNLVEPQMILSEEIGVFYQDLTRQYEADRDTDLPPVLGPLKNAEQAANAAVQALKDNKPDDAIGYQEQAADALARAHAVVLAQNQRLGYLQGLLLFQRSVGIASGSMANIVAEQRDLIEATEDIKPEDVAPLLPVFNNLRQCMFDIAPVLSLVAGRLDVGTPLAFAQTDFEDAVVALKAGDNFEAFDAQDVAAESLAEVQSRVDHIGLQTAYVAEIVDLLHTTTSQAALLAHRQAQLKDQAASADTDRLQALAADQRELLELAERLDRLVELSAGNPVLVIPTDLRAIPPTPEREEAVFRNVSEPMLAAAKQLDAGDSSAAAQSMTLATAALKKNAESLLVAIEMLHGLPSIEITALTGPPLVRLVNVLVLASDQKLLGRLAHAADDETLAGMIEQQKQLAARIKEIEENPENGDPHPMLTEAQARLNAVVASLESSQRDQALENMRAADTELRRFIVEQAVLLETKIPPPVASDAPGDNPDGSDEEAEITSGFISDFVSGETPDDKRSQWNVLGERNRAALNQNFARELPLEYRGLLKDYYERVAK